MAFIDANVLRFGQKTRFRLEDVWPDIPALLKPPDQSTFTDRVSAIRIIPTMGSYFVSNDHNAVEVATTWFNKKKTSGVDVTWLDGIGVVYAKKFNYPNADLTLSAKPKRIVRGIGTYFYNGKFGTDAHSEIEKSLTSDCRVFAEVGGHFAFIVQLDGNLFLITDKTGIFSSFKAQHGNKFYLSSSFLAVAKALPGLSLGHQEVLEFLNVETTLGQRTIFNEIEHCDPGAIVTISKQLSSSHYFIPTDKSVNSEELEKNLVQHFKSFASSPGILGCDLSGGFDSRTVASLGEQAGLALRYNTNTNLSDPNDHLVASEIAKRLDKSVDLIPRSTEEDHNTVNALVHLEFARDMYRASSTVDLFNKKSSLYKMILGGYGGELLRDVYSKSKSIHELVKDFYCNSKIRLDRRERARYVQALVQKFQRTVDNLGEKDTKKSMEKIYYHEKMRFWGGSRITAFNQFCFRYHPLLDYLCCQYFFDFSLKQKENRRLQKWLTEREPRLAGARYTDDAPATNNIPTVALHAVVKSIPRRFILTISKDLLGPALYSRRRRRLKIDSNIQRLWEDIDINVKEYLGYDLQDVATNSLAGRLLTIATILQQFKEKLSVQQT